ncbi:hypothetical protein [Pseudarthrobacter sulfonivorans]|uniref:hypothetical protein n=1 Tax=Pseudarthrobacter sulfonivorans TaxID=121292 RepID=UPI002856A47A|nr:hypothetical protein [Pseudarthrobacter sulfonivorans]MDR6417578.1 hypothetical protein [Pseudarthrobacter sulfonivorans]
MSENDTEQIELSDEAKTKLQQRREGFAAQSWYEVDPRLTNVLHLVFGVNMEAEDGSIDMTVVVDGQMISGKVVSEAAWAKAQAESIREASDYLGKGLDSFQELRAEQTSQRDQDVAANPLLKGQVRYVHFSGPKVHNHGGIPVTLPPTRVDLRNVSAWSIGSVNYEG